MKSRMLRAFINVLKTISEFVGRVVTVAILTVIYLIVAVPTGLVLGLVGKPPMRTKSVGGSTWELREERPSGLEDARHPF